MEYIEKLENEIVEELKAIETDFIKVHLSPETDADRPEQSGVYTNVFVMYTGSRYGQERSTSQVSQDEMIQIAVVIESPLLRGENGIYNVKKRITDALLSFEPSNSNLLTAVSAGYNVEKMEQNAGVFTFTMAFETRALIVKNIPEPEDWGITGEIEFNVDSTDNAVYMETEEKELLTTEENEKIIL